jgi:hypothetical protein
MTRFIFALVVFAMILVWIGDARGQYRRRYGHRDDDRREGSSKDSRASSRSDRKFYRFKTAHERLPKDIPDWFVEKDANEDGQIMMAEFAARWNDSIVAEFAQFDRNRDGVVTPQECLAAREAGVVYTGQGISTTAATATSSGPAAITVWRKAPEPKTSVTPSSTQRREAAATSTDTAEKPTDESSPAAGNVEIPASTLKYAISYVGMYDTNGDGALSADEWEKMRKSPKAADRDGDGRVTPQEYARSLIRR